MNKSEMSEQEKLLEKLRQVLEMTKSPFEAEAATAAAMLQKLLAAHNLEIADLEQKGQVKPGINENRIKTSTSVYRWPWKEDLAKGLAGHFYCVAITYRNSNDMTFVGRPENVEALVMLFNWLSDQVSRLAKEERKTRVSAQAIHPMRWLMAFAEGCVPRVLNRLDEQRQEQAQEAGMMALVVHHEAEVNDYLEDKYGFRRDGQRTKKQQEWDAEWERQKAEKAALLENDPEAYYKKYPHETPEAKAAAEKRFQTHLKRSRAARQAAYSRGGSYANAQMDADRDTAYTAGRNSADKINLQPFLNKGASQEKLG